MILEYSAVIRALPKGLKPLIRPIARLNPRFAGPGDGIPKSVCGDPWITVSETFLEDPDIAVRF
jgi:hypothetical protein